MDRAVGRFREALGADAVLVEPEQMEFHDPYEGEGTQERRPSFVVQPSSVEGVQAVLRIANELRLPIWTSSVGRNYGYGGSAPVVNDFVVLNLRRMNRVLEIDEDAGYALIEPGVQFFDLYEEIKARGAKLWMSVPDLGWGSITGNALEHGVGATVYADHASAICGMEVVLADGDVVRTASARSRTACCRHPQHGDARPPALPLRADHGPHRLLRDHPLRRRYCGPA